MRCCSDPPGIIAFAAATSSRPNSSCSQLPGDGTNAIVNRVSGLRWLHYRHDLVVALGGSERPGLGRSPLHDLFRLCFFGNADGRHPRIWPCRAAPALDMKLCAFILRAVPRGASGKAAGSSALLLLAPAASAALPQRPRDPNRPLWRDISMVAAVLLVSLGGGTRRVVRYPGCARSSLV